MSIKLLVFISAIVNACLLAFLFFLSSPTSTEITVPSFSLTLNDEVLVEKSTPEIIPPLPFAVDLKPQDAGDLIITNPQKNLPSTPSVSKKSDTDSPEYYVLKSGDNPWKIARQFKVKFADLLKMNNLDEQKAKQLKPGDKIRIK